MNVFQNLVELYNHLSFESTYRNVCKGILENLKDASEGTVYDIAELTNSSRTTVWRMVQKMGYQNFSDFHHELKRAVKQYTYYNRLLPVEQCHSADLVKEALLQQTMQAYEEMRDEVDTDEVEQIAEELFHAERTVFYTPHKCSAVLSLQQNLAMSGRETAYYCLFPDMLEDSRHLTDKSIVIVNMIEHAETMDMEPVFESMKMQQAKIYGISDKYEKYLDRKLFTSDTKRVVRGVMLFDMYILMLSEVYRMKYIR
ncbi:MAG: MurR/RpiR family transcriptional regulator [Eubacterium sp.]|nr:MurR/RpiR family transcriptional regulator [Eubacterium sp.]